MKLSSKHHRVLEEVRQADAPLGAYSLLNRLRGDGFKSPVQIYRILARLTKAGLVHRLDSLNAYVFRQPERRDDFAVYAICDNCGHVCAVADADVGKRLGQCVQGQAFLLGSTAVEVHGLCATCVSLLRPTFARPTKHA